MTAPAKPHGVAWPPPPPEVGRGLPGRPRQSSSLSSTLYIFAGAGPVKVAGGFGATPSDFEALSHPVIHPTIEARLQCIALKSLACDTSWPQLAQSHATLVRPGREKKVKLSIQLALRLKVKSSAGKSVELVYF